MQKLEYYTWSEVYSFDWNNRQKLDIDLSVESIFQNLCFRNPEKYSGFLKWLEKMKLILDLMWTPDVEDRINLLKYMYYALRLLDDICDWDTALKLSIEKRKEIIYSKYEWKKIGDLYDIIIEKSLIIARRLWSESEINYSIKEIVWSIKFDVDRIFELYKKISKNDLKENFHKMDIVWTIYWTAIIFWLNPEMAVKKLEPLWEACRIAYNLQDLQEDISAWLINIPFEDLELFWITDRDLENIKNWVFSNSVVKWIKSEIEEIYKLMKIYRKNYIYDINGIELDYSKNKIRTFLNNVILKSIVLRRWYSLEIRQIISNL